LNTELEYMPGYCTLLIFQWGSPLAKTLRNRWVVVPLAKYEAGTRGSLKLMQYEYSAIGQLPARYTHTSQ
jgi:hypothetical protein